MNTNAKKWAKALRSGEYRQGKHYLHRTNNTFCCLGVACDLAVKDGIIPPPTAGLVKYTYGANTTSLPELVKDWLGLSNDMGTYLTKEGRALYYDNDNEGLTFNQIADIIEFEPEGLFQ